MELYSYSQARASASGSLVCSIIAAALSDSSSVGMGGISYLCGAFIGLAVAPTPMLFYLLFF